jgi:uncharacterized membrane protein YdcZ (DUF606 family)
MLLVPDRFGWLRVPVHPINPGKIIGALSMIAGGGAHRQTLDFASICKL